MREKPNILFTSTVKTSFVLRDLNFLQKKFFVIQIIDSGMSALFKIFVNILKVDVTFTWFASTYSFWVVFLSKIFKKKSIIVIGGVDVADYWEINYGIWLSWWKSKLVCYAIKNATKILAVDPSLILEAKRLAKYDGQNIQYVPTGYDPQEWYPSGKKENIVLSVGVCEDEWRFVKKGFDKLIQAAEELLEIKFILIGVKENLIQKIKSNIPKNVEIISVIDSKKLLQYYQKAKVYVQSSYTEGLPNALCEAMLCGCIPVGTNRGGIPTGIGNTGFIVEYGDIKALVDAIRSSLSLPEEYGLRAREYIIQNFPKNKREQDILSIINDLIY